MTKTEAREIISVEIVKCISNSLMILPSHIQIDMKGTKNYISFKEYGVYVCFYVTSSLEYTIRTLSEGTKTVSAIEYCEDRNKEELVDLVNSVYNEILKTIGTTSY